jgi:hypothetical protein
MLSNFLVRFFWECLLSSLVSTAHMMEIPVLRGRKWKENTQSPEKYPLQDVGNVPINTATTKTNRDMLFHVNKHMRNFFTALPLLPSAIVLPGSDAAITGSDRMREGTNGSTSQCVWLT